MDFLGRNKNKEKKAQKAAAAAAAAAAANTSANPLESAASKSKFSRGIKKKNQPASTTTSSNNTNQQYESFNTTITSTNSSMFNNVALSVSNNSNRDSSSLNSEDSNDHKNINNNNNFTDNLNPSPLINIKKTNVLIENVSNNGPITIASSNSNSSTNNNNNHLSSSNQNNNGSITARSISSITGSLSFDLLDQLKLNGSDIDSEGYSIRPDSSTDLRRMNKNNNGEPFKNKDNDDMNNLYGVSSSESGSDDSDSENGDNSSGPVKVMLKIKPIEEVAVKPQNNSDVLRQISKNLQLKPLGLPATLNRPQQSQQQMKKRTYYYNYGTANPDQAPSGWSTSNVFASVENSTESTTSKQKVEQNNLTRSVSTGSVSSNINSQFSNTLLLGDFSLDLNSNNKSSPKGINATETKKEAPLLDLDLTFGTQNATSTTTIPSTSNIPISMSLNKVALENNLYNIDEDKEVRLFF